MNISLIFAIIVHCYVGCGTGSPDRQGLHVLECDTETGAARLVQSMKGLQGTTYFQFDESGKHLYSVVGERRGGKSVGSVVRFAMNGWRIGEMESVAELPCEAPCHVSLTPDGSRVAFAAYTSATAGTVGIDGSGLATYVFPNDAMGSNALRQKKAYAHQTFFLSGCPFLGVADLGCDRLRFFDAVTMKPQLEMDVKFDPGDGPRHAVASRDGRFLYVVNELSSSVSAFAVSAAAASGSSPRLVRLGKWSMLPEGFNRWEADGKTLATKAAAIKLTADGKLLMASNRGHDSIAFYAVDGKGVLTLKNIARLTGSFPRDFEMMPGEKFMVVGHKMSNEIQVYRFDRATCALAPVGMPIAAWRPLCFKMRGGR